jgi:hypothetical protein
MAVGRDGKIYVAEVLNWRFEVFAPTPLSGKMAKYVPSKRMFWETAPRAPAGLPNERAEELSLADLATSPNS